MRVLFMGTPDFGAVSLESLAADGHFEVVGAVTQPDKPKGRGHKLAMPAVKAKAIELGIPVYQPQSLKHGELEPILEQLRPEAIAVAAYGKLLPPYVLEYPRFGCINVHASLLPKYRGAAPIQYAVLNGDKVTGVTIQQMGEGLDTGDILSVEETNIGEYETAGELFDRLSKMGAELLVKTLKELPKITPVPQDDSEATYASMITKQMGEIDWSRSKEEISKKICAMNPWPAAYTYYKGETVKIYEAEKAEGELDGECGCIVSADPKDGILIKCTNGGLYLKTVQFAGGRRMSAADYLRGHSLEIGSVLGQ